MTTTSDEYSRRHFWRGGLFLLVLLPFLPEILVYSIVALANVEGCHADEMSVCVVGGVQISKLIAEILTAGVLIAHFMGEYGMAVVWLGLSYLTITLGWRHLVSRLSLALAVTLVGLLLYVGPLLSMAQLGGQSCKPDAGGSACKIFGHDVEVPGLVNLNLVILGILIALGAFVTYVIVAVVIRICTVKHRVKAVQ